MANHTRARERTADRSTDFQACHGPVSVCCMNCLTKSLFSRPEMTPYDEYQPSRLRHLPTTSSVAASSDDISTVENICVSEHVGKILPAFKGGLELSRVRFAYPSRPDRFVLDGFDLKVEPGQVVGLVGSSGSGKSSVLWLLMRHYQPQAGAVLLDGVDAATLDANWIRGGGALALVSQEPALFAASVADNIRYGRPDASDDEVAAAAAVANAASFVERLPQGYATFVGERGLQLSGGQRQRLAIARAVLANPKVLLLDEATSALDSESESLVQEALARVSAGRTVIKVAHRLNTVRDADVIVVLEAGKVVEQGRHDQLIAKRGAFYSLMSAQSHQ